MRIFLAGAIASMKRIYKIFIEKIEVQLIFSFCITVDLL